MEHVSSFYCALAAITPAAITPCCHHTRCHLHRNTPSKLLAQAIEGKAPVKFAHLRQNASTPCSCSCSLCPPAVCTPAHFTYVRKARVGKFLEDLPHVPASWQGKYELHGEYVVHWPNPWKTHACHLSSVRAPCPFSLKSRLQVHVKFAILHIFPSIQTHLAHVEQSQNLNFLQVQCFVLLLKDLNILS